MKTISNLFANGSSYTYKKKDIISSPTLPLKAIYYIKRGFIYSYSLNKNNKKMIQAILQPGNIFPLLQYTSHIPNRFYTEALTNVTLLSLDKDTFFKEVYSDKNLTQELISSFAGYLGKYVERVENLELDSISDRVVGRILHYALEYGTKRDEEIFIKVPLTQDFIAESINVARENVSRELNKLQKEKLITFKGKHLIILNASKLAKKLEG